MVAIIKDSAVLRCYGDEGFAEKPFALNHQ